MEITSALEGRKEYKAGYVCGVRFCLKNSSCRVSTVSRRELILVSESAVHFYPLVNWPASMVALPRPTSVESKLSYSNRWPCISTLSI